MASYLPLTRRRLVFRFLRYTGEVGRQLEGSKGLIGFSFRAKLLSGRFWTLSAWEDAASLAAFVAQNPHRHVMASMKPSMGVTKFAQWRVSDSAEPPTWDEGVRRLRTA